MRQRHARKRPGAFAISIKTDYNVPNEGLSIVPFSSIVNSVLTRHRAMEGDSFSMNISRTDALNLSTAAYEIGADILRGLLEKPSATSGWMIGDTSLDEWLKKYKGQELIVIVAPVGSPSATKQTCGTCGREYSGHQCTYCQEVRQRLRLR
jgi:hypothetical protein